TGSFPVRATTIEELRAGHAKGAAVRLRDARADLPTAFVRVIDRAIAADPDRRYATAGALEADLGDALDEAAASRTPVVVPTEIARSPTAFPWRPTGLLAAAVASIVVSGALGW